MQPLHERFLAEIAAERRRLSRRGVIGGSAKLAGGGALALTLVGAPKLAFAQDEATPEAEPVELEDDIAILNFALTLEHLENSYYRDGLGLFPDLLSDGFGSPVLDRLAEIQAHEQAHVDTLTAVITDLGGEPVLEQAYDFTDAYASDSAFLETAQALENVGVGAYNGAGPLIEDPALLTAAGSIVSVEARHAAYLNLINDESPFPGAVDEPLTPDEVLEAAGPFFAEA